jgi:hypothetical protein
MMRPALPLRWLSISYLSNGCAVDDELLYTVDPETSCYGLIVEGSDGTYAAVELKSSMIEVLAYMAGIKMDKPIGSFAVPPGHAVDDARPDEGYSRLSDHSLPKTGTHNAIRYAGANLNGHKAVGEGQIAIESRLKTDDVVGQQIALKGVSSPGRRDIAEGGIGLMPQHNSLRTPEEVGQLLQ